MADKLIKAGANVRAKNRRGSEPLHAAAFGSPGSPRWDPAAQAATIASLIKAGADPNAQNMDGRETRGNAGNAGGKRGETRETRAGNAGKRGTVHPNTISDALVKWRFSILSRASPRASRGCRKGASRRPKRREIIPIIRKITGVWPARPIVTESRHSAPQTTVVKAVYRATWPGRCRLGMRLRWGFSLSGEFH
jgi:hypothetical protein